MTSRNRETLRNYFGDGKLPTKHHFGDLIDSMLNMSDEGFRKSPENGFEVSTPMGHNALLSFYRDQRPKSALWSIGYGKERDMLYVQPGSSTITDGRTPVLSLDVNGRMGVNHAAPRHALDVAGVVASEGRRGTYDKRGPNPEAIEADGEWHDITEPLSGCQAFEIMAGVGAPGSGRFSLLHAVALNTYNPTAGWLEIFSRKKSIKAQHAFYGRRCDRMQLKWEGSSGKGASYRLRIRTGCNFGPGVLIKVFVTKLWFDEGMQGTEP
jgi:hypothetical protein